MKKRIVLWHGLALPGVCGILLLWPAPRCLLLGWLRDERSYAGWPASYWIEELVDERAEGHPLVRFVRALNPSTSGSNMAVLRRLRAKDPCPASVPLLVEMLEDADPELRWRAAFALSHTRSRQAIPALVKATRDPDFRLRREAGCGLAEFEDLTPEMGRSFVALLRDEHQNVRAVISLSLVVSGPKGRAALALLREMQKDRGTFPREAADALKMLEEETAAQRGVR